MGKNRPGTKIQSAQDIYSELGVLEDEIQTTIQFLDTDSNKNLKHVKDRVAMIQVVQYQTKSPDSKMIHKIVVAQLELKALLEIIQNAKKDIKNNEGEFGLGQIIPGIVAHVRARVGRKNLNRIIDGIHDDIETLLNIHPDTTFFFRDTACRE